MKNMIAKKGTLLLLVIMAILLQSSCMKEFLEVKRDKSQIIPVTLEDYRSIFENNKMNYYTPHLLGEVSSDDYYIHFEQWEAVTDPTYRNGYIWADEIFEGEPSLDWNFGYEKILYANFVLEGVADIRETPINKVLRDEIIGAAHFFRGSTLFYLAQLFCKQYNATTAHTDLGLPLRTTSNINENYQRATLEETYDLIISDLEIAVALLPPAMSLNTRPYRAAALGVLANVYLQMGRYEAAQDCADRAILIAPDVLDYNEIDTSLNMTFPIYGRANQEIVFYSHIITPSVLANSRLNIDSVLFNSYDMNDLRKPAFFFVNSGRNVFKGTYAGSPSFLFTGITTPELLLVRAECNVRLGNSKEAIADLNTLLSKRFRSERFEPLGNDLSQRELLEIALSERRKELLYRGRRWNDLKRLSADPEFSKPLIRVLNGVRYELDINSDKWVLPIPPDVINLGGIRQNNR